MTESWKELRPAVLDRDRRQCANCKRSEEEVKLDVHHIVPRGRGGSDRISNLVTLCRQCHDAVHKDGMAPVVKWYSNGKMESDEFEAYRMLWKSIDITRFNSEEGYWYIPLADALKFFEEADSEPGELELSKA